jgi:hypothetical protein
VHELQPSNIPAYVLSVAFGLAGIMQLAGINIVRDAYLRWGYPAWLCRLTGGMELLAAVLLATTIARPAGVLLAAGVNFVAVALLLKNRAYLLALPGLAAMTALPLALATPH